MIHFTIEQITQMLGQFWWPFMRYTGFFLIAPIFGDNTVPMRVRVSLAFIFAAITTPLITQTLTFNPFSLSTVYITIIQLGFGWIIGFNSLLFFTAFSMAGQIISTQMGLAMAVMNDPINGNNEAIIARLFSIASVLLFLSLNGHLLLLGAIVDSFTYWPINASISNLVLHNTLEFITWVFSSSLIMAIPAITIMLISNTVFGFMTKAAPQLNIFALGFPMTLILGLFGMAVSIYGIGDMFFEFVIKLRDQLYYLMELSL